MSPGYVSPVDEVGGAEAHLARPGDGRGLLAHCLGDLDVYGITVMTDMIYLLGRHVTSVPEVADRRRQLSTGDDESTDRAKPLDR
jgi:hypothetical protein